MELAFKSLPFSSLLLRSRNEQLQFMSCSPHNFTNFKFFRTSAVFYFIFPNTYWLNNRANSCLRMGNSCLATDYGHRERAFFQKSRTFGPWQTFGLKCFEAFGIFWAGLSAPILVLSMFSIIQPLFLQKTKPLYPTPKYLFGNGIWILVPKNLRFSFRVSVVRLFSHGEFVKTIGQQFNTWMKIIKKQQ